jgi:hypothetical protein
MLRSFGFPPHVSAAEDYLGWLREVAEAKWADHDVTELPWWSEARDDDDIAEPGRHPHATTFEGLPLAEKRAELELSEFANRLASSSGYSISDLSSRSRDPDLTLGRIEFCSLAIGRYRLNVRDVATLLCKHRNSATKWLNTGLRVESADPDFKARLDQLDAEISRRD